MAGDLILVPVMIASYGSGTMLLQMGFQRGGALITAGLATLLTNAIPIAAGMTIFHEPLGDGAFGVLRMLAFTAVVVSAVFLARRDADEGHRQEPSHGHTGCPAPKDGTAPARHRPVPRSGAGSLPREPEVAHAREAEPVGAAR